MIAKPFLKWPGGKAKLVPELLKWIPPDFSSYREPFLGGGALFFAVQPHLAGRPAVLSDLNLRLVRTYRGVRDHVENVIGYLRDHYIPLYQQHGPAFYYATRAENVDHHSDVGMAAHFIFLNKTGFNGLYRVNKSGANNVPVGDPKTPEAICDAENLRACSAALRWAEILHQDFRGTGTVQPRELFYFDSPYVPLSNTANFTAYTKEGFGPADQTALRDLALWLKECGAYVLLSNAGSDVVAALYDNHAFEIRAVEMRRNINSKAAGRGAVKEFLIR